MQRIDLVLSLPLYFLLGSCGGDAHDHDHDHGTGEAAHGEVGHEHVAPHGGALVPIADGTAIIEVVLDGEQGELTLFLFDSCAEKSLRSDLASMTLVCKDEIFELAARASGLTGESVGDTSEFGLVDERLKGRESLSGKLAQVSLLGSTLTDVGIECPVPE
ncbi:MAG TPA: hypothetical protein EYQ25_07740 [Planctomycetes bacterium]|nr:hypothetical protein [Planctomycetota bacterium]HIL36672.1 hypothetical protein [Planctomycetota bacterium]